MIPGWQRQADHCKFKASLTSSMPARTIYRDPVSKQIIGLTIKVLGLRMPR